MWRSPRPRLWEEVKVKYKKKKSPPSLSFFSFSANVTSQQTAKTTSTSHIFIFHISAMTTFYKKKKKKGCLPPPSCHSLVLLAFLCGRWPPSLCCGSLAPRPPHPSLHFHCGSYSRAYDTKTLKQMNTLLLCYTTLLKSSVFAKIICKYLR